MADNPISPAGGVPPKPPEGAKVQPKKETVRINLPPKPTSAPTIKLPTLAPGAPPPGVTAAAPVAGAAARPASAAPPPPQPPTGGASGARMAGSAPAAASPPPSSAAPAARPAPAPAPRPIPATIVVGLKPVDKILAFVAVLSSLAGLAGVIFLAYFFKDTP